MEFGTSSTLRWLEVSVSFTNVILPAYLAESTGGTCGYGKNVTLAAAAGIIRFRFDLC